MADHCQIFRSFSQLPPSHEDALTRAFLIVLRTVPIAQVAWLNLTDAAHRQNGGDGLDPFYALPSPDILTQQTSLTRTPSRLVSVLQTTNAATDAIAKDLCPSTRSQRLDGIVYFGDNIAIAIENKPWDDAYFEQLCVNVPEGTTHDPRAANVLWPSIMDAWSTLLRGSALNPAERIIIEDFLTFVDEHFTSLRRVRSIRDCWVDPDRMRLRCEFLLTSANLGRVQREPGGDWYLAFGGEGIDVGVLVALRAILGARLDHETLPFEGGGLRLAVAPGDTVGQARALYSTFSEATVEQLAQFGWTLFANPHLSFMQQHLMYLNTSLGAHEYWGFWRNHIDKIRQYTRAEWPELLNWLVTHGLMHDDDRPDFDRLFVNTRRNTANLSPGLIAFKGWRQDEANRLDDVALANGTTELGDQIGTAIRQIADVLKLRPAAMQP